MRLIAKIATAAMLGVAWAAAGQAQDVVKIGQIEAQTGPNAIYGWMGSQGVPMAVDEINKAGGFKVGDKTHKIELISLDTRGDPKEATIQLKRLLEQDKARFVYGPFLSNVFVTVLPYAKQFNGKFLLMGGATRMHDFVGTPEHDFVIRTWNWDAGSNGFGERMVDYLIKTAGPKKIAMLFQNDQGGKVLGEIYEPLFKARARDRHGIFRARHQRLHPGAGKLAAFKATTCSQATATHRSTTSCGRQRRATSSASSSWCAARWVQE
jgi:branched-chain amino acid transport system substrate-binding protein